MKHEFAAEVMRRAILGLTPREKNNLRGHLKKKTPILAGPYSSYYVGPRRAG